MDHWRHRMPKGMLLKSEGMASNLYDPQRRFPLRQYCIEHGIDYADLGLPIPLEVFAAYGLAFQKRFVPSVESKALTMLTHSEGKFRALLDNGEEFSARNVILATGISHFHYIPDELAHVPAEFLSHSSGHRDLKRFKGRDVTVIGAGSSAVDLATLLGENGADARLVTRNGGVKFLDKMRLPRPLSDRIRQPMTGLGPSWRSVFYSDAPHLFHLLPERIRLPRTKRYLGPSGGYSMKERFSRVSHLSGYRARRVDIVDGRARLTLEGRDGSVRQIATDHIIAATGFRVDLRRLPFLSRSILTQLKTVEHTPVLSLRFQSSIPGLYFVGPATANSFGPVMRFSFGAKFTAPRITRTLARTLS